jgi:hypothetical protein
VVRLPGHRTVRVILARHDARALALVTTDLAASPAALITRYAARCSIEQAFADARNVPGAGEARNRARRAVERTVPFALLTCTLIITWYARHGHSPARITTRRHAQPWYRAKTEPAFEDMLTGEPRPHRSPHFQGFRRAPYTRANHGRAGSMARSSRITAKHQTESGRIKARSMSPEYIFGLHSVRGYRHSRLRIAFRILPIPSARCRAPRRPTPQLTP